MSNQVLNFARPLVVAAVVLGLTACSFSAPSYAREGYGPHSGFHGNGGLGRGGYRFGDRFEDHHPRRAEVLSRDNRLNWDLHKDRGQLGGNYKQLEGEQMAIRRQEQTEARANGGYLTRPEQAQLNREESRLHHQIANDYTGQGSGFGRGGFRRRATYNY